MSGKSCIVTLVCIRQKFLVVFTLWWVKGYFDVNQGIVLTTSFKPTAAAYLVFLTHSLEGMTSWFLLKFH